MGADMSQMAQSRQIQLDKIRKLEQEAQSATPDRCKEIEAEIAMRTEDIRRLDVLMHWHRTPKMKKVWGSPPIVLVSVRVVSRVRDAETIRHQVLKLTPRLTGSLSAAAVSVNTRINRTFERSGHFSISRPRSIKRKFYQDSAGINPRTPGTRSRGRHSTSSQRRIAVCFHPLPGIVIGSRLVT